MAPAASALRKTPHVHSGLAIPFSAKTPFRKKIGWHITEGSIHAAVFDISTTDAAELLERNKGDGFRNRALSDFTVTRYTAEMTRGWRLTGEPLIISQSGHLLNGQHRLRAAIRAGVSFPTLIVFGISDDAFAFVDQGKKRTAGDVFSINGVGDYSRLAAATLWVWKYHYSGMARPASRSLNREPAPDQLYDYYLTHKGLDQSVRVAPWFSKNKLATPSLMVALYYLCATLDPNLAERFFDGIATGEDLNKNDPALRVRNRFIEENVGGGRLSDIYAAAFVVQAWNAMRGGKKITSLRWRTEQTPDLPFPTII